MHWELSGIPFTPGPLCRRELARLWPPLRRLLPTNRPLTKSTMSQWPAPLLQPVSYQRSVPDSRSFFFVTHVFAMFCDQETYGTDKFTAYSKGKLFNKQLFRRVNFPIQFRRMSM